MPVSFTIANHPSNTFRPSRYATPPASADDLLAKTWGQQGQGLRSKKILQTSVQGNEIDWSAVQAKSNGFVHTVVDAYNGHQNLVVSPDDVWIAILGQFNFYVNAHAEELRHHFVKHEGKKELEVTATGNRFSVDFGALAKQMTEKIHENVVDKSLKDWILPDFSTTTANDTVVCAVQMMATLKAYFDYKMSLMCGLPSVTLLGVKHDWELLLARLDKLSSFGAEPTAFASLLRPILSRFVGAFVNAETNATQDIDFWSRICHTHSQGSGSDFLSGWITAFSVWNDEGKWMGPPSSDGSRKQTRGSGWMGEDIEPLVLDGVQYAAVDADSVPAGFCEVDVKLDDNGQEMKCVMVAGHVGSWVEGQKKDTLRPLSAWFMFVKDDGSPSKDYDGLVTTEVTIVHV